MWRFRKSFSPLPGVRLTLSPSGISTSVGAGPLRVTAGPRGPHLTASIPGTGLSFRQPLTSGRGQANNGNPGPAFAGPDSGPGVPPSLEPSVQQIESAGSAVLTTPGLAEFRKLLERARTTHAETVAELAAAKTAEALATSKYLNWRDGWLMRRLMKSRFAELGAIADESTAKRAELEEQEQLARLATQLDIPAGVKASFARVADAFAQLARSNKIWDTVSHSAIDQVAERTLATRAVERKPVNFQLANCPVIQSEWLVPHLENANGGDIYLFPLFVVYFAGESSFALLEYKEIEFTFRTTRFHEEDGVPADSQVVGSTWAKTNKNGSRDLRFKENYEIPIAEYGKILLNSSTGLNEEYMVSCVASTENFDKELNAFMQSVARGA